jgi:hypothetical protein
MRLFVKVIPLQAGTGEPAGEPRLVCCPPDVEPDTILSFLTQQLGAVIDTVWTSTEHHERLGVGWVFPGAPAAGPQEAAEVACIPFIEGPGGTLQPMFEAQDSQRRQFAQLAGSHGLDTTVTQRPHRTYHPAPAQAGQGDSTPACGAGRACARTGPGAGRHRPPHGRHPAQLAPARPRGPPHRAARRPRRLWHRHLDAALQADGTLRITGHDQGLRVSEFFGAAIATYEWVYAVAADRMPALIRLLGGHDGDDVLTLLAACHQRAGGQISDIMSHPDVTAHFSNWHS